VVLPDLTFSCKIRHFYRSLAVTEVSQLQVAGSKLRDWISRTFFPFDEFQHIISRSRFHMLLTIITTTQFTSVIPYSKWSVTESNSYDQT
jgi:hypothetical protein